MKKILIVFGAVTKSVTRSFGEDRLIDNAQASGANGHKTDSIDY